MRYWRRGRWHGALLVDERITLSRELRMACARCSATYYARHRQERMDYQDRYYIEHRQARLAYYQSNRDERLSYQNAYNARIVK